MIAFDISDYAWITDITIGIIRKLSGEGGIIFSLDENGVYVRDGTHYTKPTDI